MNTTVESAVFSKDIEGLGTIHLRPLDLQKDITMLHEWVTLPYAKYWDMLNHSEKEVFESYQEIENNPNHHTFIGVLDGQPIFLMEQYKASEDLIGKYYDAQPNDYGMHILVGPPQKRISNFTWHIFSTIMDYFFSLAFVDRVVVEPDANNEKIHVLNKKAGFQYEKEVELPHKRAALAFCTRESYENACRKLEQ